MTAKQVTSNILMVRPRNFGFNAETAVNNFYQKQLDLSPQEIQDRALAEFDNFVGELRKNKVNVVIVEDKPDQNAMDSIFPNNWISFHADGRVTLYPMYSAIRRNERRPDIFKQILPSLGFKISEVIDLTFAEQSGKYLEGTGSMVIDHENKIVYASISERTNSEMVDIFADKFSFDAVKFTAYQTVEDNREPIYHTNVMMCIGSKLAILCDEAIDDPVEKQNVIEALQETGKEVIYISEKQVEEFAGNMLELRSDDGKSLMIMSQAARNSLNENQNEMIEKYCQVVSSPLSTIEACGGGSARCMIAEIFLPKN